MSPHPCGAAGASGEKNKGDRKAKSLEEQYGGLFLRTRETSVGPWEVERKWSVVELEISTL